VGKRQRGTSATSCVAAAIVEQRNVTFSFCAVYFKRDLVSRRNLFTDGQHHFEVSAPKLFRFFSVANYLEGLSSSTQASKNTSLRLKQETLCRWVSAFLQQCSLFCSATK